MSHIVSRDWAPSAVEALPAPASRGLLRKLFVPIAVDTEGRLVLPTDAVRGAGYACPECRAELILHRGTQVRDHFAHKVRPPHCDAWQETPAHFLAKQRVVQLVADRQMIRFVRFCHRCGRHISRQPLPPTVARVSLEYSLPSGARADAAFVDGTNGVLAVLEVCATHPVDQEKARALEGIPWAEVSAEQVLAGTDWLLLQDHFKTYTCAACRRLSRREELAAERQRAFAQRFRRLGYMRQLRTAGLFFRACEELTMYIRFLEDTPSERSPGVVRWEWTGAKDADLTTRQRLVIGEWDRLGSVPRRIARPMTASEKDPATDRAYREARGLIPLKAQPLLEPF